MLPRVMARWLWLLVLLSACGGPAARPADLAQGRALWDRYCALCHGAEGEGYAADNATRLNGQEILRTASDAFFVQAIGRGRPDTAMAAYGRELGGPLGDEEVDALVALIRSWQTEPSIDVSSLEVRGDADRGAPIFASRCASCHGQLGEGASAQSLSAWTFLEHASDGFLRYAIEHGRSGTAMPAFGATLSAQEIDDVVALIRRWDTEPEALPPGLRPPELAELAIAAHPDGPHAQFTLREERFVPAAQVRDAVAQGARLILRDARATSDWLRRRLPGAIPVPYYEIEPILERLPRDGTWIVAYCGCPHAASGQVVDALREHGFEHTAVLDEGVHHWISQGYPTESGPVAPRTSGGQAP